MKKLLATALLAIAPVMAVQADELSNGWDALNDSLSSYTDDQKAVEEITDEEAEAALEKSHNDLYDQMNSWADKVNNQ